MKMKVFAALAAPVLMSVAFVSCDLNDGEMTDNFTIRTANLVTSETPGTAPVVKVSDYSYNLDVTAGKVTIATEIPVSSSSIVSFTLNPISYKSGLVQVGNSYYEVFTMQSANPGVTTSGQQILNFKSELTALVYYPPTISGLPAFSVPGGAGRGLASLTQYTMGENLLVRTFLPDAVFCGTTRTEYPGQNGNILNYETEGIKYRVRMDIAENKATVIIYDAKFTDVEKEPVKTNIVLEDLALEFTTAGYTVSGSEITPKIYEAGTGTPNPAYIFNSFSLNCAGDLTKATCDYEVAGIYKGSFSGSYLKKLDDIETDESGK